MLYNSSATSSSVLQRAVNPSPSFCKRSGPCPPGALRTAWPAASAVQETALASHVLPPMSRLAPTPNRFHGRTRSRHQARRCQRKRQKRRLQLASSHLARPRSLPRSTSPRPVLKMRPPPPGVRKHILQKILPRRRRRVGLNMVQSVMREFRKLLLLTPSCSYQFSQFTFLMSIAIFVQG